MAHLPSGTTREVRRGGSGVLELLLMDLSREQADGYIRMQRPTSPESVAQLVLRDGNPVMCLHEQSELLMGHSALQMMREDANSDDSRLSVHVDVDLSLIEDLHPEARLHIIEEDAVTGSRKEGWTSEQQDISWWQQKGRTAWSAPHSTLQDDTAELASDDGSPLTHNPGDELESGYAYIVDDFSVTNTLQVAAHLGEIGHPLMVLSRTPPSRIADEFGIPRSTCVWLTERDDTDAISQNPGLEAVRQRVDAFMADSVRSVVVFDGLEYLSGLHGFDRMLGMLRDLFDSVQASDDVVLMPVDLTVWDDRQQSLLLREADTVSSENMQEWATRPAVVEGHRFCQDVVSKVVIPPPPTIDFEEQAKQDFIAARQRLLTPAEQAAAPAEEVPSSGLERDFSMRQFIDELKREDLQADVAESTTESEPVEHLPTVMDDSSPLPEWATAPSSNRGPEDEVADQRFSEEVEDDSLVAEEPDEELDTEDEKQAAEEPEVTPPKEPKSPTIDYRAKPARKIARAEKPTPIETANSSLSKAAEVTLEIGEIATPPLDQLDTATSELNAAGVHSRSVGEWKTGEIEEWEQQTVAELDAAAQRASLIRHEIPAEQGTTPARLNSKSWDAAAHDAATSREQDSAPPLPANPAAGQAASRAQKVRTLTQLVVSKEMAALYSDRTDLVEGAGLDLKVLERVTKLADKGHPVRHLVDRLEADRKEGEKLLKQYEKNAKKATKMLKTLSELTAKGVVDPVVQTRLTKQILAFERTEEIKSLFKDLKG